MDPPAAYGGDCPRTPFEMNRRFLAIAQWLKDPHTLIRRHAARICDVAASPLRRAPRATSPGSAGGGQGKSSLGEAGGGGMRALRGMTEGAARFRADRLTSHICQRPHTPKAPAFGNASACPVDAPPPAPKTTQKQETPMARFTGKSVIVTGAASGIGRASAKLFAAEGACVIAADKAATVNETVADITKAGGKAVAMEMDAGNPPMCRS